MVISQHMTDGHTTVVTTGTTTFKDRALRAIAILGLIALLLLGAWGIIQIAFTLYGFLGNGAPSSTPAAQTEKTEQVTVSLPQAVQSGTPFTLSFTHQNGSGNYAYQFSYSCANGLTVQAPVPSGSMQTVPCNTPFNYTNATSQVQLVATANGTAPIATTFTVAAKSLANNAITASANANINVVPAQGTKPATPTPAPKPTTTKPTTSYVPAKTTARTLYGSPDLAVTMGAITNSGGRYSVQFTIQNVGTNVAASGWTFRAALPTSPAYTYSSNPQQALNPGDKVVYNLGFSMNQNTYSYGYQNSYTNNPYSYPANCGYTSNYTYNGVYNYPSGASYTCNTNNYGYQYNNSYNSYTTYSGSNVVTVTVDPTYSLVESSKGNNTASATVY
jgi:hypothetical protein